MKIIMLIQQHAQFIKFARLLSEEQFAIFCLKQTQKPLKNMRNNFFIDIIINYTSLPSQKKMSGLNINCFGDCLKTNMEQSTLGTKPKKGKKCLTLIKKIKNDISKDNNRFQTNQSTAIEKTYLSESIALKQIQPSNMLQQPGNFKSLKTYANPHIIYGRYSIGPSAPIPAARNSFYVSTLPLRERRLSQQRPFSVTQRIKTENSFRVSSSLQRGVLQTSMVTPIFINERRVTQPEVEVIREQNESEKRSSLFQGAKSILSRLVSSQNEHNRDEQSFHLLETAKKNSSQIRSFYDNARLCQTENVINNTHSTIKSKQRESRIQRQPSIDDLPMSPTSKNIGKYKDFHVGRLLGVGKWAHSYLCQEVSTGYLYCLKQFFKDSLYHILPAQTIYNNMAILTSISHAKIVSTFTKFQNSQKICVVQQLCLGSTYEQLRESNRLDLKRIKSYARDLVEAIVHLHQNDTAHGNLSIFQTLVNLGQCKLKLNIGCVIPRPAQQHHYKSDINSLAVILFEMAYGINPQVLACETYYEKQSKYKGPDEKDLIISKIVEKLRGKAEAGYENFHSFLDLLLNWNPYSRLASSICLTHPFLKNEC